MRPIKIFLGDLSYFNNNNKSGLYVPVNIGYLASYTKKLFGNDVEINLFKDPNKMLDAVACSNPDVVGLSFYNCFSERLIFFFTLLKKSVSLL